MQDRDFAVRGNLEYRTGSVRATAARYPVHVAVPALREGGFVRPYPWAGVPWSAVQAGEDGIRARGRRNRNTQKGSAMIITTSSKPTRATCRGLWARLKVDPKFMTAPVDKRYLSGSGPGNQFLGHRDQLLSPGQVFGRGGLLIEVPRVRPVVRRHAVAHSGLRVEPGNVPTQAPRLVLPPVQYQRIRAFHLQLMKDLGGL